MTLDLDFTTHLLLFCDIHEKNLFVLTFTKISLNLFLNIRKEIEPQFVLSMFLFFDEISASCSYKIVLIKKSVYITDHKDTRWAKKNGFIGVRYDPKSLWVRLTCRRRTIQVFFIRIRFIRILGSNFLKIWEYPQAYYFIRKKKKAVIQANKIQTKHSNLSKNGKYLTHLHIFSS